MKAKDAVTFLCERRRTLLLGGMAVILHGLSRTTKDIDIWMDPLPDAEVWTQTLLELIAHDPSFIVQKIAANNTWENITPANIARAAEQDGMIRMAASDRPLDIFFVPNELEANDFDQVWQRAKPMDGDLRLIDEIDLIVTKQLTGRPTDEIDIRFLHDKIEARYRVILKTCDVKEGQELLDRFATPEIAAYAIRE